MDVVIQAMSGVMSITGYKDRPGVGAGAQIADVSAGMMAANGIMAALWGRDGPGGSGGGCHVDISMLDVMTVQLGGITNRFKNGSMQQPVREGTQRSVQSKAAMQAHAAHSLLLHEFVPFFNKSKENIRLHLPRRRLLGTATM